jgi:hypothetical protein
MTQRKCMPLLLQRVVMDMLKGKATFQVKER